MQGELTGLGVAAVEQERDQADDLRIPVQEAPNGLSDGGFIVPTGDPFELRRQVTADGRWQPVGKAEGPRSMPLADRQAEIVQVGAG